MKISEDESKVIGISRREDPMQIIMEHQEIENIDQFSYSQDAYCIKQIRSGTAMAKSPFTKKRLLLTIYLSLELRKKNCYFWSIAFYGSETWINRKTK